MTRSSREGRLDAAGEGEGGPAWKSRSTPPPPSGPGAVNWSPLHETVTHGPKGSPEGGTLEG